MEPVAQVVLAVAGASVTVILGALLVIARRDRRLAEGRITASRPVAVVPVSSAPMTDEPLPSPAPRLAADSRTGR